MDDILKSAQKLHEDLGISLDDAINIVTDGKPVKQPDESTTNVPKPLKLKKSKKKNQESIPISSAPPISKPAPSAPPPRDFQINNIITSEGWNLLSNLEDSVIKRSLQILSEETYKYESGQGYYPYLEYAVGLAKDRINIEKQERIERKRIELDRQIDRVERALLVKEERIEQERIERERVEREQQIEPEVDIRQKIRDSWNKKLGNIS